MGTGTQRRSGSPAKLSADEAVLLRKVVFPTIVEAHSAQVSKFLRRWNLERSVKDDLYQETFLTLHNYILERGFPDNIPAQLSLEHQEVLDKVIVNGFTHTEAAAVLGIAERTVN